MSRPDPHSYFDDAQPRTRRVRLNLDVDFERHVLDGACVLELDGDAGGSLDLDTKGLRVKNVAAPRHATLPWRLDAEEPVLGRRLRIEVPPGVREIIVRYHTTEESVALQWLEPAETGGKRHPFLFSQCQAIHARTVAPLQDTPLARIPYEADLIVPEPLHAVMSASPGVARPGPRPSTRTFRFDMPQPIPPYLLALAVGELESRDLSPRSRVWAEPELVEKAAWEFAEIESYIGVAETLFGPYDWDRYDMIVLPPSFPYGGMENPRMTFLTPTLLAGDRSLVDVVAHELAHSWTGNLISNATADHFWLNEGWTVWAERRILEALHGGDSAALSWMIGSRGLADSITRLGVDSPLTRLRSDLAGIDPDDAYSLVPYEKGARFLRVLEAAAGRPRFDAFVRAYMARFRFKAVTTEQFMEFLEEELPGLARSVDADLWLHGTGHPPVEVGLRSEKLRAVETLLDGWPAGERPTPARAAAWSAAETLVYLQRLPRRLDPDSLEWLDATFGLDRSGNAEHLVEFLAIALASDHAPAFDRAREFLSRVGRMKYLRPLYTAMGESVRTRSLAREIFANAGRGYHPIARRMVEGILAAFA